MRLFPAIDIRGGRAVRLRRGDFGAETVYADDALEAARAWVDAGARALHVVDLDGAREGRPVALGELERITGELEVPVQYGGGLRTPEAVDAALEAGAERAIVGTAALTDERFLDAVIADHGERCAVAIDVCGGRASVSGWTQATDMAPDAVIAQLGARGAKRFVYTDVERDGMLAGPDLEAVERVAAAVDGGQFAYSGGIASVADLAALRSLGLENLDGVVSGKALYERRFTVAEGQAALTG